MFSTPNLSHLCATDYERIYEPAEDSFLLLDAIEKDYSFIKDRNPLICAEIGCGSGVGIVFLARVLGKTCTYICTDINRSAVRAAQDTAYHNSVILEAIETDLLSGLLPRLSKKVDILLFNPPYVITPSDEVKLCVTDPLVASWAGGVRGREVMDRVFPLLPDILSESGIFYLVIIEENDPNNIMQLMDGYGFRTNIVLSRRSGPEFLSVLRFTRTEPS